MTGLFPRKRKTPWCPVSKSTNKMLSFWIILFLLYFGSNSSFTTSLVWLVSLSRDWHIFFKNLPIWKYMAGNSVKSHVLIYQEEFHSLDVFCTLCALSFGLAFVCFVLAWVFKLVLLTISGFSGSLISKPLRQLQRVHWLEAWVKILFICLPFFTKHNMKRPHSA